MTFEIDAGGRRHRVAVERIGDRWTARIDGRELDADIVPAGEGWSLLLDARGPAARSYEIAIDRRDGRFVVHVDGVPVTVSVDDPRRRWSRSGLDPAGASGRRQIVAPMPGRIVKLLVKPGDRVAARQGLVVVEAMKMENELRSPGEGTVAEVRVAEGMSVDANAVLVVVE